MLTDAAGKNHMHAGAKARIVCLVPGLTELMFDLGLGRQLVGRTSSCTQPSTEVKSIAIVGTTKSVDILTLAELGPSHVVANSDDTPAALIQEIIELGVEVVLTQCRGPEDNARLYDLISSIFGGEEQAEVLTAALQQEITATRQSAAERPVRNVIFLTWKNPWITVSTDTYTANMLLLAGLRTLGGEGAGRFPEIKIDRELLAQADLLLFANDPFQFEDEDMQDFQLDYGIGSKPRLEIVDGRSLSWYGIRAPEGLRDLTQLAAAL